jgi:hypothetical protein
MDHLTESGIRLTQTNPEQLPYSVVKCWQTEDIPQNSRVEDLDTNVTVQQRSNECGNK